MSFQQFFTPVNIETRMKMGPYPGGDKYTVVDKNTGRVVRLQTKQGKALAEAMYKKLNKSTNDSIRAKSAKSGGKVSSSSKKKSGKKSGVDGKNEGGGVFAGLGSGGGRSAGGLISDFRNRSGNLFDMMFDPKKTGNAYKDFKKKFSDGMGSMKRMGDVGRMFLNKGKYGAKVPTFGWENSMLHKAMPAVRDAGEQANKLLKNHMPNVDPNAYGGIHAGLPVPANTAQAGQAGFQAANPFQMANTPQPHIDPTQRAVMTPQDLAASVWGGMLGMEKQNTTPTFQPFQQASATRPDIDPPDGQARPQLGTPAQIPEWWKKIPGGSEKV